MIVTLKMPAYKLVKPKSGRLILGRKGSYDIIAEVASYPWDAHLFTLLSLAFDTRS